MPAASEKEVDRHGTSVQLGNGCCFLQIPLFYLGDCLMKKSLIALAALGAFAGAASAQSSVTLYGVLDVGVSKQTNLDLTAYGVSGSSFHIPTRIGIKGTEDLGNGMSAIFDLQTGGIGMGDGKSGNTGGGISFGREAYAGLKGGFGTVKAGLDASVATYGFGGLNLNGISTSDAAGAVGIEPVLWYGSSRRPAYVSYTSPNMAGLDVMIGYTLKGTMEDVLAIHDKASTQARVNYAAGPLSVAVVVETARNAASETAYGVGAKYNLGMADVTLRYVKSPNGNDKGLSGGVAAKFGAATAGLQLAKNSETKDMGIELFANYALSK
jgi:predicted porin